MRHEELLNFIDINQKYNYYVYILWNENSIPTVNTKERDHDDNNVNNYSWLLFQIIVFLDD